jgi:hypothetical protein
MVRFDLLGYRLQWRRAPLSGHELGGIASHVSLGCVVAVLSCHSGWCCVCPAVAANSRPCGSVRRDRRDFGVLIYRWVLIRSMDGLNCSSGHWVYGRRRGWRRNPENRCCTARGLSELLGPFLAPHSAYVMERHIPNIVRFMGHPHLPCRVDSWLSVVHMASAVQGICASAQ